jgi:hypothetical protein
LYKELGNIYALKESFDKKDSKQFINTCYTFLALTVYKSLKLKRKKNQKNIFF